MSDAYLITEKERAFLYKLVREIVTQDWDGEEEPDHPRGMELRKALIILARPEGEKDLRELLKKFSS